MNDLYPLKFIPIYKEKIWGGNKLKETLGKNYAGLANCGESWEISGVPGEVSVVSNGFLKGNSLEELVEVYMGDLVGDKVYEQFGTEFPLLIKFIDAREPLSIQVHPNDELAMERHESFGKTEMWYVVQADPGATLISGFNRSITADEYLRYLAEGKIEEVMNLEPVKAGDVFFMPAGRVHAIGRGIVVAEIQQTSDVTYRIYDFNRKDDQGNLRELHTDLALEAIDFTFHEGYKTDYTPTLNQPVKLVECPYFTTNLLQLTAPLERDFSDTDTFVIYLCLEGSLVLNWEDEQFTIQAGETVLIPAQSSPYKLTGTSQNSARLLEVFIA